MFEKLKLKLAARRVEKSKAKAKKAEEFGSVKHSQFWITTKKIVSWPFRALKSAGKKFWHWVRFIDLIGMVNLTLLVTIIVLFSVLISEFMGCRNKDQEYVLVASDEVPVTVTTQNITVDKNGSVQLKTSQQITRKSIQTITLPLIKKSKCCGEKIRLVKAAKKEYNLYGDVIVDSIKPNNKLACGVRIQGNLYLQNMRQYTLPCNIEIDGNLFLRDVEMLKFCGDFTITGNIYVSRNSSFGPIPKTARLGGQIIF
ncbi:MAG TPA: hypothetical protein PKJ33_03210 [Alphaproteobacteria bacterium]|nr:hypothetical protein [Alphaproteobacteria bacterium]